MKAILGVLSVISCVSGCQVVGVSVRAKEAEGVKTAVTRDSVTVEADRLDGSGIEDPGIHIHAHEWFDQSPGAQLSQVIDAAQPDDDELKTDHERAADAEARELASSKRYRLPPWSGPR